MKIAEALVRIKDMKGKLATLVMDIHNEQSYEQIDQNESIPSIEDKISEFSFVSAELANLKDRINRTNTKHRLSEKIYTMEALRSTIKQLDCLTRAKQRTVRLQRVDYDGPATQIATFATYNVEKLAANLDVAHNKIREIDLELQRLNWEIDLEE